MFAVAAMTVFGGVLADMYVSAPVYATVFLWDERSRIQKAVSLSYDG